MTAFNTIPKALTAAYRAGGFFTDALTAYPNAQFSKPSLTTAWAALFLLPSAVDTSAVNGSDDHTGVLQIDLNYPRNTGAAGVQQKAAAIAAVFKRGAVFTADGQRVECGGTSIGPGEEVDGWYRVPVSVEYRAFVAR